MKLEDIKVEEIYTTVWPSNDEYNNRSVRIISINSALGERCIQAKPISKTDNPVDDMNWYLKASDLKPLGGDVN